MLPWERSRQPEFAASGTASEAGEFRAITIFWSVGVKGDFVLSVNGIVWQKQLANEVLPHQRLCSLGVSSSRLTTNRNSRWYLGFPKQEAAKSSKRAIHFPLIMMLLLYLLGEYQSVFQRLARKIVHPHFSLDGKANLPRLELRGGCYSMQNWLNYYDSGFVPFCSLPPTCDYQAIVTAWHSPHSNTTTTTLFFFRSFLWKGR